MIVGTQSGNTDIIDKNQAQFQSQVEKVIQIDKGRADLLLKSSRVTKEERPVGQTNRPAPSPAIGNRRRDTDKVYFEEEGAMVVSKAFYDNRIQNRTREELENEGLTNVTV